MAAIALTLGSAACVQRGAVPEPQRWRGAFVYQADAATFTDCASGRRWPVATTGDYLAAERHHLQARSAPGAAVGVVFDGRLEVRPAMEGAPREHIVIDRLVGADSSACASAPTLQGTDWKLVELDGQPTAAAPTPQREVRLTLAADGRRASGFSGCNRFAGSYEQDGAALRFAQLAGTRMACVAPAMELESRVLKMFGATTAYRIDGQGLHLLADGRTAARFEAVARP